MQFATLKNKLVYLHQHGYTRALYYCICILILIMGWRIVMEFKLLGGGVVTEFKLSGEGGGIVMKFNLLGEGGWTVFISNYGGSRDQLLRYM